MLLNHLDHPCFNSIKSTIFTKIRSVTAILPEHIVTAFASIISQSIIIPSMSPTRFSHQVSSRIHNVCDVWNKMSKYHTTIYHLVHTPVTRTVNFYIRYALVRFALDTVRSYPYKSIINC